jgi:hypothetical protein
MKEDLRNLEETWNHQSDFVSEVSGDTVSVSTDDMIFHYLNEGTEKNYAIMTSDFVPKTTVGSLAPNRGWKGGKARLTWPLHSVRGIEARGWSQLLLDQYYQSGQLYNIARNTLNDAFVAIIGMIATAGLAALLKPPKKGP